MIPALHDHVPLKAAQADDEVHILIVAPDAIARFSVASLLLDAGFSVTTTATFGVVEVLLESNQPFDLMVVAQSADQITQFGVPQLARSIDPDVPIVVLEFDTANAPAVVDLVNGALSRWPLRDREERALH